MHKRLLVAAGLLATLPACFQFEVQAQAGYASLAVDGDLGYQSGTTTANVDQGVDSAFGLGDDQGSPFVRAELDTGVQVLSVSAFQFEESGQGNLQADFGGISASPMATVAVNSDFELTNIKGSYAFEIPLGPVSIAPGIAVDYFDLSMRVSDTFGAVTEEVDLQAPIPLGFVRGEAELGPVRALVEVGYMSVNVDDVDGSLLDAEAMLLYQPTALLELFAGYRHLNLAIDGQIDGDTFDTDITVSGWILGGGVRF